MISYVNILRSIAIIGVITIHTAAPLLAQTDNLPYWLVGNILEGAVRWSVPVFVMVSGMLLLNNNKKEPLKIFMRKRASKIIIPFIGWVLIYTFWEYKSTLGGIYLPDIIRDMIGGNVSFHLWFLYMIVGLYLITPLIRVLTAHSDWKLIEYYLIVWFITSSLFTLSNHFLSVNVGIQLQYFSGYLGYFLLGYYLHNIELTKRLRKIIYAGGLFGVIVTIIGTYLETEYSGNFAPYFYEYLSPNNVLASIAIFVSVKNIDWDSIFKKKGIFMKSMTALSISSFGVYLIHPLVMIIIGSDEMKKLIGFKIRYTEFFHPIIGVPVSIIIVLIISYTAVRVMNKIPFINKLVP
ncbi:acyltransferase [Virgibacillus sp. JSM 102003]|uniref:acyltransferase n=1 Tax=Virgibacillus sp. JSM 102003 TaxID=1562108 RepID=UPI0035BFD1F6